MTTRFMPLKALDLETLRSLQRLERILEVSGEGLFAFDRDLRLFHWSPTMIRLTGLSGEEVVGCDALELFPFLGEAGEHNALFQAVAGQAVPVTDQAFNILETGRTGFLDVFYSPLEAADGQVLGGVATVRDATERKRSEAAHRETEIRFQTLVDAPTMLWMSRTDALCTFFNQTWLEFTGRALEQEWGVGWAEGIHPEDFQRAMDTYIAAFNERRAFQMEYRLQRRDGEYRWLLDHGVPRFAPDGTFVGYIGSCVDINDRRRVEADLREAVQARDEFLSIASHELRTPLTSLQLQLQMFSYAMSTDGAMPSTDRLKRIVEISDRQVGTLTRLIESLLEVSRIQAAGLTLTFNEVELTELVAETVERLSDQLARAGCRVELRLEDGIRGHWDRFRLEQVLVNLLSNVIRYAAGSRVEIATSRQEGIAILTVRDEGPGIPESELPRIFQRFHRSASSRHYGGLGLGLYIVQHIISSHGGSIRAESENGEGTCIIVELPLAPPEGD